MATIAVLGTFDTKPDEHLFVANLIRQRGHKAFFIDVGIMDSPGVHSDVSRHEVAAAGAVDLEGIVARRDRGEAVTAMSHAAARLVLDLQQNDRIQGLISLGGGGGTAIATAAMRGLPIGFPKVMVSTLASGNTAQYVGSKDIVMFPSIVDVAGLNRISRQILTRAAGAICGMVEAEPASSDDKPVIVASMFGNTTQCVQAAKGILEREGFEVLVFHATGTGGRTMESLIETRLVSGVLDVTTTEWADEVVGGYLTAGPTRLEAAARSGTPAIVTPGCLDMVNFLGPDTVPERFRQRNLYAHNPQVTLMRTSAEECEVIGRAMAQRLNLSCGPVTVLLPLRGVSVISAPGQKFHDPEADAALFSSLKSHLRPSIPVRELDCLINDPIFAEACAKELLENMRLSLNPRVV